MLTSCRQCAESSTCSFASISNGTGDTLLSRQQERTASCLSVSPLTDGSSASGWKAQSLNPTLPIKPFSNNGSNFTTASILPPVTTDRAQVSSSVQLTTPSTMAWTMLTVTRTVTSLLTTTFVYSTLWVLQYNYGFKQLVTEVVAWITKFSAKSILHLTFHPLSSICKVV